MTEHGRLFSPLQVGRFQLPNRVVMPSMGTNMADSKGRVTQAMLDYYQARAAGRPGLMVVEAACVHPSGRVIERHFMNHDESSVEDMSRLAQAVKGDGQVAILQIIHGGRNSHPRLVGELLAPSPLRGPTSKSTPRGMTLLEIEAMVDCFARAAERAVRAGFDGVEVHGAHEYLVHQFLTPYCNQRLDAYGGSGEGRLRFAREVVQAVRAAMGPDAILAFRLSGDDHVKGGLAAADAARIAAVLERDGVDLFSVTGGVYETPHMVVPPLPMEAGTHMAAAAEVKKAVSVPVAGVGRVHTAAAAESFLDRVDLVACGRAFLADPLWLEKTRRGETALVRPCIGCNQGCIDRVLEGLPITCVANPWLGLEGSAAAAEPAAEPARVTVVGGGLSGMEAARALGELGHAVVLFEASPELGGQVRLASLPPGKAEFMHLVEFYLTALSLLPNVEVRLGSKATVKAVCQTTPQAVVVASGSRSILPSLPGVQTAPVVSARQVLSGAAEVGKRVAVLGGGNLGSEVAHLLASRGHEVCIIELGLSIGADLGPARRYLLRRELGQYKIKRYVRARVRRLFTDQVSFLHAAPDGSRQPVYVGPLDTFVSALGARPEEELYLALEGKVPHLYLVGDALSPARMGDATAEGARAALEIHGLAMRGELAPPADKC